MASYSAKKVYLSNQNRETLEKLVNERPQDKRSVRRAKVILALDKNNNNERTYEEIAKDLKITASGVLLIKENYLKRGIDCIYDLKRIGRPIKSTRKLYNAIQDVKKKIPHADKKLSLIEIANLLKNKKNINVSPPTISLTLRLY